MRDWQSSKQLYSKVVLPFHHKLQRRSLQSAQRRSHYLIQTNALFTQGDFFPPLTQRAKWKKLTDCSNTSDISTAISPHWVIMFQLGQHAQGCTERLCIPMQASTALTRVYAVERPWEWGLRFSYDYTQSQSIQFTEMEEFIFTVASVFSSKHHKLSER